MNDSNETQQQTFKKRDPKLLEAFQSLEKTHINEIQSELNQKYNFKNNISDIIVTAQNAIVAKCKNQLYEFQKHTQITGDDMNLTDLPAPKLGEEREYNNTLLKFDECRLPISQKLEGFKAITELMNSFSLKSSEFCLDDCEEELHNNKNIPDYNISNCLNDCFRNVKYNSFTLGKFVDTQKESLLNSFFEDSKI